MPSLTVFGELLGRGWGRRASGERLRSSSAPGPAPDNLRYMIKGITLVRPASTPAVYDTLVSFFSVLGFEDGRSWEDETSRGRPFLAPLGNLEFVDGMRRHEADTFIEVTQLDAVREVAERWLKK